MKRTTIKALATSVAAAATLVAPAVAQAGTYRVYSCKTPTGAVAPVDGWTSNASTGGASSVSNTCGLGGSMAATLNGDSEQAAGWHAEWRFDVPEDLSLSAFEAWRSMSTTTAADVNATPVTYISWPDMAAASIDDACASNAGCNAKGSHAVWTAPGNHYIPSRQGSPRSIFFVAACNGAVAAVCTDRNSQQAMADVRIHAFQADLVDDSRPVVSAVTGTLTATRPHSGTEAIGFSVADLGAGVYRGFIEVKRSGSSDYAPALTKVLDTNGGRCVDAGEDDATAYEFLYLVPCAARVDAHLQLDTTTLPDGVHELRVRVEDASGNTSDVHGPVAFEVDNVPPPGVSDPDGGGPGDGMPSIAGAPVVGTTLVGDKGTWSGDGVSYAFEWLRCPAGDDPSACTPIAGATGAQYQLTSEDLGRYVRLRVTAANAQGSANATSRAIGPVVAGAGGDLGPDPGDNRTDVGPGTPNNGTNASDKAVVRITSKRRRTVGFGRRTRLTATLRDENGRAITGAQVAVLQRMSVPGASWSPAREPLVTDAAGRLRWRVPAKYSRTVRLAYKANLSNADFQSTSDLVLTVRSKTTIRTSRRFLRNGERVRFTGRLLGRPVPPRGVLIDMQARVGRRWQTFQTTRTKRNGRWATGYRFRSTRGLQTYSFRARVRHDTAYPYAISRSKTARVRVAG